MQTPSFETCAENKKTTSAFYVFCILDDTGRFLFETHVIYGFFKKSCWKKEMFPDIRGRKKLPRVWNQKWTFERKNIYLTVRLSYFCGKNDEPWMNPAVLNIWRSKYLFGNTNSSIMIWTHSLKLCPFSNFTLKGFWVKAFRDHAGQVS